MIRPVNILLIDEDVMVCEAIAHALAVAGYDVISAASDHDALRALRLYTIDMVLLDVHPRQGNGWDTARHLNILQPELPIIAMSARLEQHESSARNHRFRALLAKPLDLAALIRILDDLSSKLPARRRRVAEESFCAAAT